MYFSISLLFLASYIIQHDINVAPRNNKGSHFVNVVALSLELWAGKGL